MPTLLNDGIFTNKKNQKQNEKSSRIKKFKKNYSKKVKKYKQNKKFILLHITILSTQN